MNCADGHRVLGLDVFTRSRPPDAPMANRRSLEVLYVRSYLAVLPHGRRHRHRP
jgi:hypothetical protein